MMKSNKSLIIKYLIFIALTITAITITFLNIHSSDALRDNKIAKLQQKLENKTLSVLGDSISTYEGYSNDTSANTTIGNNAICYYQNGIISNVNFTWWMRTVNLTHMELLVNNSFSGDRLHEPGIGLQRAKQLHSDIGNNQGKTPDIIVVYFGINDYISQFPRESFGTKYNELLDIIATTYSNATVFCCTLPTIGNHENAVSLKKYNIEIRNAAFSHNCHIIDLHNKSGITANNLSNNMFDDWLHPNKLGMEKIANCFIDALFDVYIEN